MAWFKEMRKIIYRTVAEWLMAFPLLFIIGYYGLARSDLAVWSIHLMIYYPIGYLLSNGLRKIPILITIPLIPAGTATLGLLLNGQGLDGWISAALAAIIGFRGMIGAWSEDFPVIVSWISVALYFACSLLFNMFDDLEPYTPVLTWLGLATLAIAFFITNQERVRVESFSGKKEAVPLSVMRQNQVLVIGVLLIVLLIGSLGHIRDFFVFIGALLVGLTSLLFQNESNQTTPVGDSQITTTPGVVHGPNQSPSDVLDMLQLGFWIAAGVILGITAIFALYFMWKLLLKWMPKLLAWLSRFLSWGGRSESSGYEDQKMNLLNLSDSRDKYWNKIKVWMADLLEHKTKWSDLANNRDRIRFLYRRMLLHQMLKGYSFKSYYTPKETGEDMLEWKENRIVKVKELAKLYNLARYGNKEPSDDEVRPVLDDSEFDHLK